MLVFSLTQPWSRRTRTTPLSFSRCSYTSKDRPLSRTPALSLSMAKPARIWLFLMQAYLATGRSAITTVLGARVGLPRLPMPPLTLTVSPPSYAAAALALMDDCCVV